MIFDIERKCFESEKERNLYTKFFAGYFLNEFIEGYQQRIDSLNIYISQRSGLEIQLTCPHVSFDNHAYLFDLKTDRGEFADILFHDVESKTLIAIEAKYHSNLNHEKDIIANLKRSELIQTHLNDYKIYNFLLLSKTKWDALKNKSSDKDSNYTKLVSCYKSEMHILFWEDLTNICTDKKVQDYMHHMLSMVNKGPDKRKFSY